MFTQFKVLLKMYPKICRPSTGIGPYVWIALNAVSDYKKQ